MKLKSMWYVIVILAILCSHSNPLQAEVKLKGLVQSWVSVAAQEGESNSGYGFTMRRVRLKPYGTLGKNIEWGIQVGWDKQTASLLDAYIDYKFTNSFRVKVGQFAAPGTVSGALTSSGALDQIERAMVSQNWGGNAGLFGYRGLGIQAHGELLEGKLYYALMLANPKTNSLFTPSVKSSTYSHDKNGVQAWGRLEVKPLKGLRIGTFYGGGKDDDDYVTDSYGAHLFYADSGWNFKLEYIAGKYGMQGSEQKYNGLYASLGYRLNKLEPNCKYDWYTPNDGAADSLGVKRYNNITFGLNYFYSKEVKFQANYVLREETMNAGIEKPANNIFYICFQYSYN